jgi:hypothetical protein
MTTRTPLDKLVTHAALGQMVQHGDFMRLFSEDDLASPDLSVQIKNVCAKVSAQLSDEIDSICGLLGISKRIFLEAAFIEAIEKAKAIIDAEGLEDYLVAETERINARSATK